MHARRIGAARGVRPGGPAWRVSARRRRERRNRGYRAKLVAWPRDPSAEDDAKPQRNDECREVVQNREDETGRLVAFDRGGRLVLVAPETVLRDFGLLLALIWVVLEALRQAPRFLAKAGSEGRINDSGQLFVVVWIVLS